MLLLVKKSIRGLIEVRKDFDKDLMEIILNRKVLNLNEDKRIIFLYASPFNSSYTKSRESTIIEKFETKDACCRNALVLGDLNGRTGRVEDFVRDDRDKHCPADNPLYTRDSFLSRNNTDCNPVDQQGKLVLDLCKNTGLRILNGRTFGDSAGNFTRYPLHKPTDKPSVIDYALCGQSFLPEVFSFSVLPFTDLSDHCCISTSVKINRDLIEAAPNENVDEYPDVSVSPEIKALTFDADRLDIFKENIRKDDN